MKKLILAIFLVPALLFGGATIGTPTGLPPTGAAGGDLSGNYPNPTVNAINLSSSGHGGVTGALAIANGGTGATTAAVARVNLNIATTAISASAINWSLSNTYSKTLAADTTFTFSNQADGEQIVVAVTNTSGNYLVTWPAVSWVGGTPPVQTVGAHTDIYTFLDISGTIYGNAVQNF